jgi:hypothetical protein
MTGNRISVVRLDAELFAAEKGTDPPEVKV